MGTQNVYLYDCAYVSRINASTSYHAKSSMPSNMVLSKEQVLFNSQMQYRPIYAPLLQFLIPSTLKYKKITRVRLSVWVAANYSYTGEQYMPNASVSAYQISGSIDGVTWNNMESKGILSPQTVIDGRAYLDQWQTFDITSIYNSALVPASSGNYFSLFVHHGRIAVDTQELTTMYGVNSTKIPYLTIDYEDVAQLPPTPSYPHGITIKEGQSVLFSWIHNSETEAVQASYQLEYKKASASSWTTVTGTTAHSYTLTSGLEAGDYVWRVKITNDAGETSAYSSTASFAVVGRPSMPVIGEPVNKCLTTITWNGADQNSAELTLTDTKGNVIIKELIANASTSYKVNEFLKGVYTVGIRVKNSIDLWSDWAYKTFVIDAEGPDTPTLEVTPLGTSVFCEVRDIPDGASVAIMRAVDGETNYKCIGLLDTDIKLFSDNTVCSGVTYRYVARAYIDGYTDSYARTVSVLFDGMVLNSDNFELHLTESNDKYLVISEDISCESSVMHFSGREFPIVEKSEFTTWRLDRKFFVTPEQRQELEGFLRLTQARYRDSRGRSFPCALLSVKYSEFMDEGYIATLSLIRTAEDEVIINV